MAKSLLASNCFALFADKPPQLTAREWLPAEYSSWLTAFMQWNEHVGPKMPRDIGDNLVPCEPIFIILN